MGVRGIVHDWFKSYLADRYQFTYVNSVKSEIMKISCGVPQGSVLGPLLFLVYMNDIGNVIENQKIKLFADDTNLFVAGQSVKEAADLANKYIDKLYNWLLANKLSLNIDKTCYMVFPHQNCDNVQILVNGKTINKVTSCRYLGVIIDDELNWSEHIQHVFNCLVKYVGIFYKLRCKLPYRVLRDVYYAFVHSHLLYAVEVYANTSNSCLDKLIKLNNKLLRILQNKPLTAPIGGLYDEFKTLSLPALHKQQLILLAHRIIWKPYTLPEVFNHYFDINASVHNYSTRNRFDLHQYRAKTTHGQKCLKNKIVKLWNELPSRLKESESISYVKESARAFLLKQT